MKRFWFGLLFLILTVNCFASTETMLNVKDYSLVCDDSTDDSAALNTLVNTTLSTNGGTIYIPSGVCRLGSNLTVPSNVTLHFSNGGSLRPANSVTLTINGPIEAGPTQIFINALAGQGTVVLGGIREESILPQWWGAKGDTKTIANATMAIGNTLTASVASFAATDVGKTVLVPGALATSVNNLSCISGSRTLTGAASTWLPDDVGKIVDVSGCGFTGGTYIVRVDNDTTVQMSTNATATSSGEAGTRYDALKTTIASYTNSTNVVLTDPATAVVSRHVFGVALTGTTSGYTSGASISFGSGCSIAPVGTVLTNGSSLYNVKITKAGSGCTSIPSVTIAAVGAGVGAAGVASAGVGNITNFGTDDTAAITAAINAVPSENNYSVTAFSARPEGATSILFPRSSGAYFITSMISIPQTKNIRFYSQARNSSRLLFQNDRVASGSDYHFRVVSSSGQQRVVDFENLVFDSGGVTIDASTNHSLVFRKCDFVRSPEWAIYGSGATIVQVEISNCAFTENVGGVNAAFWQQDLWRIDQCNFVRNNGVDLKVQTSGFHVSDTDFEQKPDHSFDIPFIQIVGDSGGHQAGGDVVFRNDRFGNESQPPRDLIIFGPLNSTTTTSAILPVTFSGCLFRGSSGNVPSLTQASNLIKQNQPVQGLHFIDNTIWKYGTIINEAYQANGSASLANNILNQWTGNIFAQPFVTALFSNNGKGWTLDGDTNVTIVSTPTYTVLPTDKIILVKYTATGNVIIYLPPASLFTGKQLVIKDMGGAAATHVITINRNGTNTINGGGSITIGTNYGFTSLISDGISAWGTLK